MNTEVKRTSQIQIKIGLNEESIPVNMQWQADDNPAGENAQPCKAMLLSLFDREHRDTYKIDLWTYDMEVHEMDRFFYHTLRSLSETYLRATQNNELANDMAKFVQYFGEKTEVLPK